MRSPAPAPVRAAHASGWSGAVLHIAAPTHSLTHWECLEVPSTNHYSGTVTQSTAVSVRASSPELVWVTIESPSESAHTNGPASARWRLTLG
jgi:hypothetical protein